MNIISYNICIKITFKMLNYNIVLYNKLYYYSHSEIPNHYSNLKFVMIRLQF